MKNLMTVFLAILIGLTITACNFFDRFHHDMEEWNVTATVFNNSDYDITDIAIIGSYGPELFFLEKGSEKTLSFQWRDFAGITIGDRIHIQYKINGEQFSVKHQEDAVWYKSLPIGQWEWEEDGVSYRLTMGGENYEYTNEIEGEYLSLHCWVNGTEIKIFIQNRSFKVEGGAFKRIHIPLLPPWFRDDYPEAYFEYDRGPGRH
ncbi:MAG: hypothetical protein FWG77_11860 [Treponema sp.]|nr:hypothetical protein [Treponema sp.]